MPAWPARPSTVIVGSRLPRHAIHTSRPLGSGTIAPSACSVRAVDEAAGAGRLLVRDGVDDEIAERAGRRALRAPRPRAPCRRRRPSCRTRRGRGRGRPRRRAANGSCAQRSRGSTETTSMWPFRSSVRPPPAPAKRATSCGRPANEKPSGIIGCPANGAMSGSQVSTTAPARSQPCGEVALQGRLVAAARAPDVVRRSCRTGSASAAARRARPHAGRSRRTRACSASVSVTGPIIGPDDR